MGKIIVSQFITLDGVFEDPGGCEGTERGGWAFRFDRGAAGNQFKLDELKSAGALLLGRVAYEGFARVWPSRTDEIGFAERMNTLPKYVVSTTLVDPVWSNSTILGGDTLDEISKLKHTVDGEIRVYASSRLVHTLIEHDLVDELRLTVFPLVMGVGNRLFDHTSNPKPLRLVDRRTVGDSLAYLAYQFIQDTKSGWAFAR